MRVPRVAALGASLALLPLGLAGCGLAGDGSGSGPTDDRATVEEAAAKSRERVQAYLDAMKAKDAATGRSQFCTPAQKAFDAGATGPNGDFARHFTVTAATITGVSDTESGQRVGTAVTVRVGKRTKTSALLFTVTREGANWCISDETIGELPVATPSATASSQP